MFTVQALQMRKQGSETTFLIRNRARHVTGDVRRELSPHHNPQCLRFGFSEALRPLRFLLILSTAALPLQRNAMTDLNFHIDTPRLTLSHFNPALDTHCDLLVSLWTQPSALRATGGVAMTNTTRDKARKQLELEKERIHPKTGHGRYLVSLKTSSPTTDEIDTRPFSEVAETYTKIGTVSMKTRQYVDMPVFPDLGYGLLEEYEGKGYATEAAMALMKYFEEVKGQKEFIGLTHPDNERSIKMMRRLGFREEGERAVLGFTPDGKAVFPLCWSRGLEGELPRSVTVTDE